MKEYNGIKIDGDKVYLENGKIRKDRIGVNYLGIAYVSRQLSSFDKPFTDETIAIGSGMEMIETKIARGTNFHSKETREKLANLNREKAKDPEFRKKLSMAGRGRPSKTRGNKFINKNGIEKSVKPEELQAFLNKGWTLGRNKKK